MPNDHIILNVHLQAAAGREEEAATQLQKLVAPTRKEPGCVNYVLHRAPEDPTKFMFYEEFRSQTSLEEHTKAPHFQEWVAYQAAHDGLIEKATVTYWRSLP
ncbi:MAG: putative quinol monooxygenase [Bryobacteraceae bacterium]